MRAPVFRAMSSRSDASSARRRVVADVQPLPVDHAPDARAPRRCPGRPGPCARRPPAPPGAPARTSKARVNRPSPARSAWASAERLVAGGLAPPDVVVVHAGQVVVDERIGMDELDGAGEREERRPVAAEGFAGREKEERPESLSAGQDRVAHGFEEPATRPSSRRSSLGLDRRLHLGRDAVASRGSWRARRASVPSRSSSSTASAVLSVLSGSALGPGLGLLWPGLAPSSSPSSKSSAWICALFVLEEDLDLPLGLVQLAAEEPGQLDALLEEGQGFVERRSRPSRAWPRPLRGRPAPFRNSMLVMSSPSPAWIRWSCRRRRA